MKSVTFVVDNMPPWEQTPADDNEKARQIKRKQALQEKARESFNSSPVSTPCAISIRYCRNIGRLYGTNIVGGVTEGLQGIIFEDDKQVVEISYCEWSGDRDWYQITVTELTSSLVPLTADQLLHSNLVGLWEGRKDIDDSAVYARQLRGQAQRRQE